jgi:hypothetical protein
VSTTALAAQAPGLVIDGGLHRWLHEFYYLPILCAFPAAAACCQAAGTPLPAASSALTYRRWLRRPPSVPQVCALVMLSVAGVGHHTQVLENLASYTGKLVAHRLQYLTRWRNRWHVICHKQEAIPHRMKE